MNNSILKLIEKMSFGEVQTFSNLAIVPIFVDFTNNLSYLVLDNALNKEFVEIVEINEGGSVPELFLVNKSDEKVLLVDGEELIGAKQNRIINTSLLIQEQSKTKIPVSCVEQGRWSYSSPSFGSSGYSSSSSVRRSKSRSVSASLGTNGTYRSDQNDVWRMVRNLSNSAKVNSASGAMYDVFDSRKDELERLISQFPVHNNQKGYAIFMNGELIGFDYVSDSIVFRDLYNKLLKGYAIEALLNYRNFSEKDYLRDARTYICSIKECNENQYKSVGMGYDYRYINDEIVASALVVNQVSDTVVHFSGHNICESENFG